MNKSCKSVRGSNTPTNFAKLGVKAKNTPTTSPSKEYDVENVGALSGQSHLEDALE